MTLGLYSVIIANRWPGSGSHAGPGPADCLPVTSRHSGGDPDDGYDQAGGDSCPGGYRAPDDCSDGGGYDCADGGDYCSDRDKGSGRDRDGRSDGHAGAD